jgi:ribosomal protein L11 methyltransferase
VLRLAIRVRREDAELVLAELLELAPGGVEEVELGDGIEYAVYGAPGELPALPDLRAAVGAALVEVSTREIPDDWAERWREFHRPLVLGGAITVRPPWEPPGETPIDVVIDPGQAFGTGAHATTRLSLELMVAAAPPLGVGLAANIPGDASRPLGVGGGCAALGSSLGGEHPGLAANIPVDASRPLGPLLDLGCGSGVLGIVGARLGWKPVVAVDFDPASVEAAGANAAVNGVDLDVRRLDLRTDPLPAAPTVVANLLSPLLIAWAARLGRAQPRRVIASGILEPEADEVARAFAASGLQVTARRARGEWVALLLERTPTLLRERAPTPSPG